MARSFAGGVATDEIVTGLTTTGPFTGAHSIYFRFNRIGTGGGGFGRYLCKVNSNGTNEMSVLTAGGVTNNLTTDTGGNFAIDDSGGNIWEPTLIVYDASNAANVPTWYRNGNLKTVTTVASPSGPAAGSTGPLTIGNRSTDQARCFQGYMCEVAVWSVLLPAAAAATLGLGSKPVSPYEVYPDNLVLYMPLLGDSPEPDYSGTQKNGTVTGATVAPHPGVRTIGFTQLRVMPSLPPATGAAPTANSGMFAMF